MNSMLEAAKGLSRNPLGIIALFIVLVYGFAALVTGLSDGLGPYERLPLIYFLVLFPVLVLGVFAWLVSNHANKLYGPGDFKDEGNFVRLNEQTLSHVSANLALATAASQNAPGTQQEIAREVSRTIDQLRDNPTAKRNDRPSILWVDDNPSNNTLIVEAFETLGINVVLALSTKEALNTIHHSPRFSAIISDMGRKEGAEEGYILLKALRGEGDATPFFIYASSGSARHHHMALERGAQGSTNDPNVLFREVMAALRQG